MTVRERYGEEFRRLIAQGDLALMVLDPEEIEIATDAIADFLYRVSQEEQSDWMARVIDAGAHMIATNRRVVAMLREMAG